MKGKFKKMTSHLSTRPTVGEPAPSRILIVDDHAGTRRATRMLLEGRERWTIVGEAADGHEAVDSALRLKPDVIVMDVAMPRMSGLQAAERISAVLPETRVLLFTLSPSPHLAEGQEGTIRGIVSKQNAASDLPEAVDALLHGGTYFGKDALYGKSH